MVKQTWNIGNEERERILNLHEIATKRQYLIIEQSNKEFVLDFGNTFQSGQYEFNPQYKNIVLSNVQEIAKYIQSNNLKDYKIVITPSESQVPNQPPFDKEKGSLAKKRGEYLKEQLKTYLKPLLNVEPEIEVSNPLIGNVPWDPKKGKDHSDYTKDQFTKVSVVLKSENKDDTKYRRQSDVGEAIYLNNHLVGYISEPLVRTTNIKEPGFQDVGRQNLTFTEIKKDTVPQQIVAKYQVPWVWWNQQRQSVGTRRITPQDLQTIRSFEKIA